MRPLTHTQGAVALTRPRLLEYLTLTKPELTLLSMLTAVAGFLLGGGIEGKGLAFLALVVGTGFVGGGAGALNQFAERSYDALMHRTAQRPIPSGRLPAAAALVFGLFCSATGLFVLGRYANLLTACLGGLTLVSYLAVYTPLKRISPVATLVGAIPGALPPVMGWTAAQGSFGVPAGILFTLLFCWQIPHFLSLAWMYRKDYERAGYRILAVLDQDGSRTARQSLLFLAAILPLSLWLGAAANLGGIYVAGALLAGAAYLFAGIRFSIFRESSNARLLFLASLFYFPVLFLFMIMDRLL
jgi:protoheme IX farnesyltransferase